MLPVVGDVAQSDGGISRGAERKLGIVKTCLGMVLGKVFVRVGYGRAHGKVRTRNLARDKRKVLARHGMESGKKAALGSTAPT